MDSKPYSADRSLVGKLRRRFARLVATRPAHLTGLAKPLLTISFDDAPVSAAREGAAVLARYGVKGTYFISAAMSGRDSHLGAYTTADDIRALEAAGHEIACHTLTHLDCGRARAGDIAANLQKNQDALKAMGVAASKTFAYPYGDVSPAAKSILNDRYLASRALHHGLITTGTDLNQTPAVGIEGTDGAQAAFAWLQRGSATPDSWLVLYTHDVRDNASDFGCTPETLDQIIAQAIESGFEIVTFEAGARRALGLDIAQAA